MSLRDKAWDAVKWKMMKSHLGYSDEEMKIFRENPRNEDILSKAPELLNKTIVFRITSYNVCYTKLLRHVVVQKGRVVHVLRHNGHDDPARAGVAARLRHEQEYRGAEPFPSRKGDVPADDGYQGNGVV